MQWRVPPLEESDISRFLDEQDRTGIEIVCVHASYLINLGTFDKAKLRQSRQNFVSEMERTEALEIPYLVVHPGSHLGKGEAAGIAQIAASLNYCIVKTPGFEMKILLETTAGQGTNLGYRFEQLAEILEQVEVQDRAGVCVDTCHIFAAGYELRTPDGYDDTLRQLDACIGLDRVHVIHCNDSRKPFGSRLDRHEHIAEGELGRPSFDNLVNDKRLMTIPMIIETPGGPDKDKENLAQLRRLCKTLDTKPEYS
jgi:deoxyribonuclease-4